MRGKGRPKALTQEEEMEVFKMHQEGKVALIDIAYKYRISVTTVHRIVTRILKGE